MSYRPRKRINESLIQKYAKEFDKKHRKDFDSYDISDYVSGKLEYINKNLQENSAKDSLKLALKTGKIVEPPTKKDSGFPVEFALKMGRVYSKINNRNIGLHKCIFTMRGGGFCENDANSHDPEHPFHCKEHAQYLRNKKFEKELTPSFLEFDDSYFMKTGGLGAGSMLLFLMMCLVISPLLSCFISMLLFIVADILLVMVPARKRALETNKRIRVEELKEMEPEWDRAIEEHDRENAKLSSTII